jgi:hypothetical protein
MTWIGSLGEGQVSRIEPQSFQLNGKAERSLWTDQEKFSQLLTYAHDVDLNEKLAKRESFFSLDRPHEAFQF